jgi:hypothetical protein
VCATISDSNMAVELVEMQRLLLPSQREETIQGTKHGTPGALERASTPQKRGSKPKAETL